MRIKLASSRSFSVIRAFCGVIPFVSNLLSHTLFQDWLQS